MGRLRSSLTSATTESLSADGTVRSTCQRANPSFCNWRRLCPVVGWVLTASTRTERATFACSCSSRRPPPWTQGSPPHSWLSRYKPSTGSPTPIPDRGRGNQAASRILRSVEDRTHGLTASTAQPHSSRWDRTDPETLCVNPTVPEVSRGLGQVRFPTPPLDHGPDLRKRGDRSRAALPPPLDPGSGICPG